MKAVGVIVSMVAVVGGAGYGAGRIYHVLASPAKSSGAAPLLTTADEGKRLRVKIDAETPVRGAPAAQVSLVMFCDFTCPHCRRSAAVASRLLKEFPTSVRVAFKHFPRLQSPGSVLAAEAVEAARVNGRFWEMHDRLFAEEFRADHQTLERLARDIGMEADALSTALSGGTRRTRIDDDVRLGAALGIPGTPTVFVNGRPMVGFKAYDAMKAAIEAELGLRPAAG
jgi:protein-disulfide isomerase